MTYIFESKRKIPVLLDTDVVVVGGGPAGLAASIAAARNGAKTLLIERYGYLGGMITAGICPMFMGVNRKVISGVFTEFLDRLSAEKATGKEGFFTHFDHEVFKAIAQDFVEKAGVKLLLHSWVVDAIVKGSKLEGIIMESKSGRQAVKGKVIVDASGDGDIAAKAGVPFDVGGSPEQSLTLLFRIGGVNKDGLRILRSERKEFTPVPHPPSSTSAMFFRVPPKVVQEARNKGELSINHEDISIMNLPLPDIVLVNAGHITGASGTNVEDLTRSEIQSRKEAKTVAEFLKKNISGFESSFILDTPIGIGVRETRRIVGEYVLTKGDIVKGKRFSDAIAQNMMPIDIHGPGEKHTWIPMKKPYDIPYRCLLPKSVDNLIVAGRCISTDHQTQGSIRSIPCCFATGQASGIAAALAIKSGSSLKELDIKTLQETLVKQGAKLNLI
jgi:hypothetical protein